MMELRPGGPDGQICDINTVRVCHMQTRLQPHHPNQLLSILNGQTAPAFNDRWAYDVVCTGGVSVITQ